MRFLALALVGVGFVLGLTGFAPNMPTVWLPFGAASTQCTPMAYDLGGGLTDLGNFTRVFVASGC